jgi:ADP-ribosyl-[dinitrogen reductase] hydrolase
MASIDPNLLKRYPNAITQADIDQRNRFLGVLAGLAVGDALGAPHEFAKEAELAEAHPRGPRAIVAGASHAKGAPSEETQLALLVAESVSQHGRFDLADVAQRLVKWLDSKPRDLGPLMKAAIENLRAGDPPDQAGAIAWEDADRAAADNAVLTSVAVLALLHLRQQDTLVEDVVRLVRTTHYDPRCVGSALAVAVATGALVRGDDDAWESAASAARRIDDRAGLVVERALAREPSALSVDGKNRSEALVTLELAISVASHAESFEDGLVAAVAKGGDTDANAAVAGMLLGARFGRNAIPDEWVAATQACARLKAIGEALHKKVTGK